jgi:hydrogenase maturation protein HypF
VLTPCRDPGEAGSPLAGAAPEPFVVDVAPLMFDLVGDVDRGVSPEVIARRFHSAVVQMIGAACLRLRRERKLDRVVLSGGVFQNAILAREVPAYLEKQGFSVWVHAVVPPNDGGLALGQLAVSAHATGAKGLH